MSGGVWAPFKELSTVVHSAIALKQSQSYYQLEGILKKHKPDFISLLKNPVGFTVLIIMISYEAKCVLVLLVFAAVYIMYMQLNVI